MPCMFEFNEEVVHLKTKNIYRIISTPGRLMIEKTKEPAYAYRLSCDPFGVIWIRPQTEMEDGRFEKVK